MLCLLHCKIVVRMLDFWKLFKYYQHEKNTFIFTCVNQNCCRIFAGGFLIEIPATILQNYNHFKTILQQSRYSDIAHVKIRVIISYVSYFSRYILTILLQIFWINPATILQLRHSTCENKGKQHYICIEFEF